MSRSLGWYARRLRGMSPAEAAGRAADQARQLAWARRRIRPGQPVPAPAGVRPDRRFTATVAPDLADGVDDAARQAVVAAADEVLAGRWSVFGVVRTDLTDPDWFLDPVSGRRAPSDLLAFSVDHRDESVTGNVKSVWEISRHHQVTVLAAAWWLTGRDEYAEAAAHQLRSWWAANPFLSGVHWTSGIELGVRLVSWAWTRRLLDGWSGAADLFEGNPLAVQQIWAHQRFLAAFRSRGSSANNHVIAEACGRLVAACAFPWYAESDAWRGQAAAELEHHLLANTFPDGVNRELASDYHRFVAELGLVAAVEAQAAGFPLSRTMWDLLARTLDTAAALLDEAGNPPRQGDGDEGMAVLVDDPEGDPWARLLSLGAAVVGPLDWWPATTGTVVGQVAGALVGQRPETPQRPVRRPDRFDSAGLTILRAEPAAGPQIWCRCDGGPHGFLSIAAHGHADALSVEVRVGGVEILVDPGTYCYHGEPPWRSYFRSTAAHNTVEIDGSNQSVEGGPFLWSSHARTTVEVSRPDGPGPLTWAARHTGYERLTSPVRHARTVTLDPDSGSLEIVDELDTSGEHDARLMFHLGPQVQCRLEPGRAELSWTDRAGRPASAVLTLADGCSWTSHRGELDPILGWYSPRFGVKTPTTTLVGTIPLTGTVRLSTVLDVRSPAGEHS